MPSEIERKFLVCGDFKPHIKKEIPITQGYLSLVPERTVRVRTVGDKAFLTIKGMGNDSGTTRFEWEHEISLEEARDLLRLCEPGVISKTRYLIESGSHTFEVDEFHGENQGLIIAEIELSSEAEEFLKPTWLGDEVTSEPRYFNAMLMQHPYSKW